MSCSVGVRTERGLRVKWLGEFFCYGLRYCPRLIMYSSNDLSWYCCGSCQSTHMRILSVGSSMPYRHGLSVENLVWRREIIVEPRLPAHSGSTSPVLGRCLLALPWRKGRRYPRISMKTGRLKRVMWGICPAIPDRSANSYMRSYGKSGRVGRLRGNDGDAGSRARAVLD